MPNLIVSTCGTSLLTNGADENMRRLLVTHANAKEQDMDDTVRRDIDTWVAQRRNLLKKAADGAAAQLSAELNGLLAYQNIVEATPNAPPNEYYLVVTDTYLGNAAFECIEDWLCRNFGRRAVRMTAGGLNTSDVADFRAALAGIAKQLGEELSKWRERRYRVVFNLTGGFKSVNGFMQAVGMLFADECFYLFEGSRELMRVPRLPITLDARGAFEDNLLSVP